MDICLQLMLPISDFDMTTPRIQYKLDGAMSPGMDLGYT